MLASSREGILHTTIVEDSSRPLETTLPPIRQLTPSAKFSPTTRTPFVPFTGPRVGSTCNTPTSATYSYCTLATSRDAHPLLPTLTSTMPPTSCEGLVHTIFVEDTTSLLAATSANMHSLSSPKPFPVTVHTVPPLVVPFLGKILYTSTSPTTLILAATSISSTPLLLTLTGHSPTVSRGNWHITSSEV